MHAQPMGPLEAGDDTEMEQLLARSASAMAQAGLTAQDFLEALPDVRAEVRRELYDEEYLREIERYVATYWQGATAQSRARNRPMLGIPSRRLFLDAGVVIQGFVAEWGAPKALLVLATVRESFTIVLAQQIEREVRCAFARRIATTQPSERLAVEQRLVASFEGWLARVALERPDAPAPDAVYRQLGVILPALRHTNDLEAVVSAMQARPDWVISTNTDHWGPALAVRTGLHIGTPIAFLEDVARVYVRHAAD